MEDLRQQLDEHIRELNESQQAIDALHLDLGSHPDLEGKREAQLLELMAARDAATARLGVLLSRWVRAGGKLELVATPEPGSPLRELPEPVVLEPARPQAPVDLRPLARGIGPAWARRASPPAIDFSYLEPLEEELHAIGEPRLVDSEAAAEAELDHLSCAVERFDAWSYLPKTIHRLLLALTAARGRHLQVEATFVGAEDPRLQFLFKRLRVHQSRCDPGFVFGLSQSQVPRVSWLEEGLRTWAILRTDLDAPKTSEAPDSKAALRSLRGVLDAADPQPEWVEAAIETVLHAGVSPTDERLLRLLSAQLHLVPQTMKFRTIRKAVRSLNDPEDDLEVAVAEPALPADWGFFEHTRNTSAAIVSAAVREDARQRLEKEFGFSALVWESAARVRSMQALAHRINQGHLDLVILVVRFMSHPVSEALIHACKSSATPHVFLERGYGVQNLKLAIERHLAEDVSGDHKR